MLVLTRCEGEALMIGNDIGVTVLGIKGGQVRFGIAAPASVRVLRDELLDGSNGDDHTDDPRIRR